jgi:rhamnosyl/mannosyltransferase
VLIKAMRNSGIHLVIAGDGPELPALKSLAGNDPHIHFLGKVTEEEKNALLQQATLVVLPSIYRSEAFGVCLLEAMQYKKPLITTELDTGTSYVNQHEVTGLVVAPNDVNGLKEAIWLIFNDKALQAQYGQAAFDRYQQQFTMDQVAKHYQGLYEDIMIKWKKA